MEKLIIKKCSKCGALVEVLKDCSCDNCGIVCCGEKMEEIIPNSMDAVAEKHIPTYEKVEDEIFVKVNHVMDKEHYIEWLAMIAWIALVNNKDIYKVNLSPEQNAECRFKYIPGSKVYAYCNKHGLWSTEIK